MKYRNGFVTNSSSSSFIVAFDEIPQSVEDVKKMLFDEGQEIYDTTDDYSGGTVTMTCDEAAQAVFNALQGKTPNDMKEIKEAYRGWLGGDAPDRDDFFKGLDDLRYSYASPEYRKAEKEYEEADNAYRMARIKRFMKENKNRFVFTFDFGDEGGVKEGMLEHGDLFSRVPHMTSSNH